MIDQLKNEILRVLETGTPREKSFALEEIWEARDVSLVSPLVDVLEKEKSRVVKERILMVLSRLVPLSELRDVDIGIHIDRMLRSSDPYIRRGIVEIMSQLEMPINFIGHN